MTDLEQAHQLAGEYRWEEAAEAFERAAPQNEKAWEAAGEAWRRADLPVRASKALQRALETSDTPLLRLKWAGVLSELGEPQRALEQAQLAFDASDGPIRAMAADTAFDQEISLGQKERARTMIPVIRSLAVGDARQALELSLAFRIGQLMRMDGELADAVAHFGAVIATSLAAPEAAPARAAAESELAELALLLGDVGDAVAVFSQAKQRFLALGRQGLAWRCEAGRVRAAAEAGEVVDLSELDRTLSYARDQGHVVLGIDVQIARGTALSGTASESAFREAIALADRLGHVARAGRARVSWARTGEPPLPEIRKAVDQLVSHRPWHARARWELARRTQADPGILAKFEAMGMAGDIRRALAHGQVT